MDLHLNNDDLNACVQCGLCLPHCPTFRVTGDELLSPRGRIALMREVHNNDAPLTNEVLESFDTCVQCRGCEPACPSGVPYGRLIESTRDAIADDHRRVPWWQRIALRTLARPRLLRVGGTAIAVAARLRLLPRRLGLAGLSRTNNGALLRARHRSSGSDVYLFTGCVMDVWQRPVHIASQQVVEAAGFTVTPTADLAPCCGALQAHSNLHDDAVQRAEATIAALSQDNRPILVNSAGCGAAMKSYGELLETPEAESFSARVFDIQEWLAGHLDSLPAPSPVDAIVAVQDPCHLRHVQRKHVTTRTVLAPHVRQLVELDDDGLCCGAGGAYSFVQPQLASDIADRKVAAIRRARPDLVASANPGCSMHLAGKNIATVHPMQLVAESLGLESGLRLGDIETSNKTIE